MDLQGPDFSDSRDPIFSDSRDPMIIFSDIRDHGRRKDFFQGGASTGFSQNFFQGETIKR